MKEVPQNVSESVRKLNPHLYDIEFYDKATEPDRMTTKPAKRVNQSHKQPNKLEAEFARILRVENPNARISEQSVTFKIGNGVRYSPDLVMYQPYPTVSGNGITVAGTVVCYEVKGKHAWDDAIVKLKVAAHEWPWIAWWLVWKEDGKWQRQQIIA